MKAIAIAVTLSMNVFPLGDTMVSPILKVISEKFYDLSNLFLFHFGISVLTCKTPLKINYKIFPLLLLVVYIIFNFMAIIDAETSRKVIRYGFGFTGSFLASIGFLNLYMIKTKSKGRKYFLSTMICCTALLFYAVTEILNNSFWFFPVEFLRLLSALALLSVPVYIVDLIGEDRNRRIGYV
ncbi:MAG TPA: hypothetical protein ENG95_06925 [Nitrospirae bacterium]|nr:hypothetical protein [Nitrospirota bacterium]HDK81307.1 hypothetical protein [Nitrospirota bacterium]HDO26358.1 hypothetical protein [Nitrospirota bacterium]